MIKEIEKVVLFQIDRTSKVAKQYSQAIFDRIGLNITTDQWVLLKIIHENAPLSQRELAKLSVRDPASITRTLDLLENKRHVYRKAIEGNRRQYNIDLTQSGKTFVQDHLPLINQMREQSLNGFTKDEMEQLLSYLSRIQENMK